MTESITTELLHNHEFFKGPLEDEFRAFRKMLSRLLKKYKDEYVAIYQGKLMGHHHHGLVYRIDLAFNSFDLKGISCITARRNDALLGRNVLNRFFITLDGPNLTFDIK